VAVVAPLVPLPPPILLSLDVDVAGTDSPGLAASTDKEKM